MTQSEAVLAWLREGKTLTPAEAYERFGTLALHSRISELRSRGHCIEMNLRSHNGKRFGEYQLMLPNPGD